MREWIMIAVVGVSGILGAVGGTGFKPARRFILPFILGVLGILAGLLWVKCILAWFGWTLAFHMPYGEKTPYWGKFLVGCGFVAPTLLFGFTPWVVIVPSLFVLMFWLSNTKGVSRFFPWKVVEFLTFALVGVAYTVCIHLWGKV